MSRKKWTAKTEVTDSVLKVREKRKWQIALRRYVLEQKWSAAYAPYFGLDIQRFREWIHLQFGEGMTWNNFSERWQFDHIVPVAYFDFGVEEELRLCWNFINIRVQAQGEPEQVDILGARTHFRNLYEKTGYPVCQAMAQKLEALEQALPGQTGKQEAFLTRNRSYLDMISGFSEYEFSQLNEGIPMTVILEGRDLGARFDKAGGVSDGAKGDVSS
ncbi:hypothetical protein [Dinghuibacter silviterrae]|uniref:Uncharacterized protein n=1 Tax=Dinghuibacter silviterrae TaxID=1539049 RepID=A0A4R8DPN2_9BACT|nr:hypothetical protein [Dinghuibacter silviterrae]TDW99705.1 hypothetical protein EDB95_0715 [Dinghuibacter silviterrae]